MDLFHSPVRLTGEDGNTKNLYAYGKNNPLRYLDYDGHECIEEKSYLERSLEMMVLGELSDEATWLGLGGSLFLSFIGLDFYMDIRDLAAKFTVKYDHGLLWAGVVLFDVICLLTPAGVLKNLDEGWYLLKNLPTSVRNTKDENAKVTKEFVKWCARKSYDARQMAESVRKQIDELLKSGSKGGTPPMPVENKNITGIDCYDYFRETYGKENVCWENCNPSEVATAWQGSYPYVGVRELSLR